MRCETCAARIALGGYGAGGRPCAACLELRAAAPSAPRVCGFRSTLLRMEYQKFQDRGAPEVLRSKTHLSDLGVYAPRKTKRTIPLEVASCFGI